MASAARIACVVLSIAACGSGQVSPRPSSPPPPTVAPTPSAGPTATAQPTPSCPSGGADASNAILNIWTLESVEEIDLEAASGLPTVAPAATLDPSAVQVVGSVLGGRPTETILFADEGAGAPPSVTAVVADFVPFGSGTALTVQATVEGAAVQLRLPDGNARGTLRIAIAWTSACGTADAAGELALQVLDSSVAAGCPTSEDELIASMSSLDGESIEIGTLDAPLAIVGWSGRWLLASGVNDGPQFEPWVRDAVIQSAPGASVVVRHAIDDLQLLSVRMAMYERGEVEAYLEPDSTTELTTFDVVRRNAGPLGRVGIPAPLEPGRYVFETQGTWQTPCLNLVTYNAVSVEVR